MSSIGGGRGRGGGFSKMLARSRRGAGKAKGAKKTEQTGGQNKTNKAATSVNVGANASKQAGNLKGSQQAQKFAKAATLKKASTAQKSSGTDKATKNAAANRPKETQKAATTRATPKSHSIQQGKSNAVDMNAGAHKTDASKQLSETNNSLKTQQTSQVEDPDGPGLLPGDGVSPGPGFNQSAKGNASNPTTTNLPPGALHALGINAAPGNHGAGSGSQGNSKPPPPPQQREQQDVQEKKKRSEGKFTQLDFLRAYVNKKR